MKGIMRFGKKGKLALRYIRPFSIVKKIGKVTYRLDLLENLDRNHMQTKFNTDPLTIMWYSRQQGRIPQGITSSL